MEASTRGLSRDRIPASVDEARAMVAYNERMLATSQSAQRRQRAERMLANVRPVLARLEQEEADRLAKIANSAPAASSFEGRVQRWRDANADDEEYEVVWNGSVRSA